MKFKEILIPSLILKGLTPPPQSFSILSFFIKDQNTGEEKSERPDDRAEEELDLMDEKWRKEMEEAVLKLRSTMKKKLVQLGIKPEGDISDH